MRVHSNAVLTTTPLVVRPSLNEVWQFIEPLSNEYPEIRQWFNDKVQPGVLCGTRKLFTVERDDRLVAVAIAKREDGERKLCSVRVAPEMYGKGLGVRLIEEAMGWLDERYPLLTVSEEKIGAFARIFDYFGYRQTRATVGLYRPGRTEFTYNS